MSAIFLSASVPLIGRGSYHETADPFLIQTAVRELVMAVVHEHQIVWGGHPAITPMIWRICQDLDVEYAKAVTLYQSRFFAEQFPEENAHFKNVVYVDAVADDREGSLLRMRQQMLSRGDLKAAVFIGGMDGVEREYELFREYHGRARVLFVAAPGGAAREMAQHVAGVAGEALEQVDFASLYERELLAILR
jgi:hypothetical protein